MKNVEIKFSKKDIPIPAQEEVKRQMVRRTYEFIVRLRWRILSELHPEKFRKTKPKETYQYKTEKFPTNIQCKSLEQFEKELWELIKNMQFRKVSNEFQRKLKTKIKEIKTNKNLIIESDKTYNFYEVPVETYKKLMVDEISKAYKRTEGGKIKEMDTKARETIEKIDLEERIMKTKKQDAFCKLKDHKDMFQRNPAIRLINPTRQDIGQISRLVLKKMIKHIKRKLSINLWDNTQDMINWIKPKWEANERLSFIQLDVVAMYPSIKRKLFESSLAWAKGIEGVEMSRVEEEIIMANRASILINDKKEWEKTEEDFDVGIGSKDGSECCELVDCFILSEIAREKIMEKENIGTFRDDFLGITDKSRAENERTKKKLIKLFEKWGLKIEIETNKTRIQYLDVDMNSEERTFGPYQKPNNRLIYVNKRSNHSQKTLKHIPQTIEKRLNTISSSREKFQNAKPEYERALKDSGYQEKLTWTEEGANRARRRKKKRNTLYYNPPFSQNIKTKTGKEFLKLIKKWFESDEQLKKKINRKTIKISYSSMRNLGQHISNHNIKILNQSNNNDTKENCNCVRSTCPIPNGTEGKNCRSTQIVYKAKIYEEEENEEGEKLMKETKNYIGGTSQQIKSRVSFHNSCIRYEHLAKTSELAKYGHKLKRSGKEFNIKWEILELSHKIKPGQQYCRLCIAEMHWILYKRDLNTLNGFRMEQCKHKKGAMICSEDPG